MKILKKIFALVCVIFICQATNAQISKGGVPVSFAEVPNEDTIDIIQITTLNNTK